MNLTAQMMQAAFGDKLNQTFAILGNHDVYPHWDFNAKGGGNPAVDLVAFNWGPWLNDYDEQLALFKKFGYFSKVLNLIPGKLVKVIGLNTEACDVENRFIFSTLKDPLHQFEFLINELDNIER